MNVNDKKLNPNVNEMNGGLDQDIESVPLYSKKRVMIPSIIALVIAVIGTLYWYFALAGTVSTDDAYIDANRVTLSSKYAGRISELLVDEGSAVKKGDVLVRIDDSDLRAQETQAKASLEYATRNLEKSQEDYERAQAQFSSNVITKEQYDHAKKALELAKAQDSIASAQLGVVKTQLTNTMINAPMDGIVSKKWAMPGDVVQIAQPIFTIYDIDNLWVTANLEETRYSQIRLGDEVHIYVDSYGGKKFNGKVIQLGANTASEFSLIPPNNASGNFTKVTQRIPVKISIDASAIKKQHGAVLLPGMSVEVRLKVK
jgi:membrane fusion protein (multidrug efflux system)